MQLLFKIYTIHNSDSMEFFSNFLIMVVLFLLPLLVLVVKIRGVRGRKLPPGPWKLPIIGNLHQLGISKPHVALKEIADTYGPLMYLKLGERSAIIISSHQVLKEAMKKNDLAFANRPALFSSKTLTYNNKDIVTCHYGDYWKQMRNICILELLSPRRVQSIYPLMEEEISLLVTSINKAALQGTAINMSERVSSLSCAITCRASVGKACNESDVLICLIRQLTAIAGVFNISDLFPSLKLLNYITGFKRRVTKLQQQFDRLLEEIVSEHEATRDSTTSHEEDLVHVLLRLRDKESHKFQMPITRENIKCIVLDMFVAGTETSATTMEWAMSELVKNPTVMRKAQAEAREILKGKKIVDHSDLQNLKYLKLVIKETLRLHPPALLSLPRETREECEVNGYVIPNKTIALVNMWAMGRNPHDWRDPEKFYPERFNEDLVDINGNPFEFAPFGVGKRYCPGSFFGLSNVELTIARLLYHFDWKLPNMMDPSELDMSEKFGAAGGRFNDLYLIASPYVSP